MWPFNTGPTVHVLLFPFFVINYIKISIIIISDNILVKLNQMKNCLPGAHRAMINYLIEKKELEEAEDKVINFLLSGKALPKDYLILHSLDMMKPKDKRPVRPSQLSLETAMKR